LPAPIRPTNTINLPSRLGGKITDGLSLVGLFFVFIIWQVTLAAVLDS